MATPPFGCGFTEMKNCFSMAYFFQTQLAGFSVSVSDHQIFHDKHVYKTYIFYKYWDNYLSGKVAYY